MDFRILGTLQVCEGDEEVPVRGTKQRALLGMLLLHPNQPVSEDVLIESLWGDEPSARAADNLHVLVSRLRRVLGTDRLLREGTGYLIRIDEGELDVATFERLRGEGKLRQALELWRGDALADFTYETWAQNPIRRLEELRLVTLEERIERDLAAGVDGELVGELQGLVAEHPLREALRRHLIVALYRSERQAEALEAYRDARRMLDEELGLEPSPALRELERAVLRHDRSLERPRVPPAVPTTRTRRPTALAAAALALVAAFAAAIAAIRVLDGDEARRVAAAAPTTTAKGRAQSVPRRSSTTRVVVIRERTRPPPPPPAPRPSPPPIAPPPAPPPSRRPPASPPPPPAKKPKPKPKPRSKPAPAVPPTRIADDFGDGAIDREVWQDTVIGIGSSVSEANGRLEVELRPEATGGPPEFAAQVVLGCKLPGDFDVRVDFELLDWPAENGVTVHLAAIWERTAVDIARQSHAWGENYGTWFTQGTGTARPTTHLRGALRIRRQDWYASTYYRNAGRWERIGSFFTGGAPRILLKASSTDGWFADKTVRVAFDNFTLTAKKPSC